MGSNWSEEIEEEESDSSEEQDKWVCGSLQRIKHPGVAICKEILKRIKLKKEEEKENKEILKEFLSSFIDELKEVDELFNLLFKELSYEGSYYLNLRVSTPDEFDINLILKPPFKDSEFEIEHQPFAPSYVKIFMKDHSTALKKYPRRAKTLFDDGYLIPENVRNWLQSNVDKAVATYIRKLFQLIRSKEAGSARKMTLIKRDGTEMDIDLVPVVKCVLNLPESSSDYGVQKRVGNTSQWVHSREEGPARRMILTKTNGPEINIDLNPVVKCVLKLPESSLGKYLKLPLLLWVQTKEAGPARTIILTKTDDKEIDIDLVPVVKCLLKLPESSLDDRVQRRVGNTLEAYLVPKPYTSFEKQMPINEARRLWRCHFPKAEKKIIYNKGCVKPIIKLLKFLRDKEDWKILASYYLKTVVMWMVIENNDDDYWKEDKMDNRFLDALEKLAKYVGQKKIPYIFNTDCNLIEKIGHQEAYDISNRLNSYIRNINQDINYLRKIF